MTPSSFASSDAAIAESGVALKLRGAIRVPLRGRGSVLQAAASCGRVAAQLAADRKTIEIGQIEIEDEKVETALLDTEKTLVAVNPRGDAVALALEVEPDRERQIRIILDDGDAGHGGQGLRSGTFGGWPPWWQARATHKVRVPLPPP